MMRFFAAALLFTMVGAMDGDGISQPSQAGTLDKIRIAVVRESGAREASSAGVELFIWHCRI